MELSVNNRETGQTKSATAPSNEINIEEKASVQTSGKSYLGVNIQDVKTLLASLAQSQGRVPQAVSDKQQKLSRHLESIEKRNAKPVKETGGESSGRLLSSLITRIIGKYPEINREISNALVKEDLSSQSGDKLSAEISRNIANMPKLLQSDTTAGKALLEFVAQAVVAKLDEKTLSENWKKQIGDNNLTVIKNTNPREQQEISRVLDDSVKFIYKNQSGQLKANTGVSLLNSLTGNVPGEIRSSTQNIQVRPTDPSKVTYLNMFTQIANTKSNPEVTTELLQKINNIIIKAAQIAIESNLIEPPTDKLSQIIEEEDFSLQDLKFVNNLITKAASGISNQPVSKSVLIHSSELNLAQKSVSAAAKELTEGEINAEINRHMDVIHNSNDLKIIESTLQKINELNKQLADLKARTVIAEATKPDAVQKANETGIKTDSNDVLTAKTETTADAKSSVLRSSQPLSSLSEVDHFSKQNAAEKTDNSSGKLSDQIRQGIQKQDSNQISQTKLNASTVDPDRISKTDQQVMQGGRQPFTSGETQQMPRQSSEPAALQQPARQAFTAGEAPQMPRQSSDPAGLQQPSRQAFTSGEAPQVPRQSSETTGLNQPTRQVFTSVESQQMPRQSSETTGLNQPTRLVFTSVEAQQMPRQSSEPAGLQQSARLSFASGEVPQMPRQSSEATALQQPAKQNLTSGDLQMPRQSSEATGLNQPARQVFTSGEAPQMQSQSNEPAAPQQPAKLNLSSGESSQSIRQNQGNALSQRPSAETQQNDPVNRNSGDAIKSAQGSVAQESVPSAKNRTLPPGSSDSDQQNSVDLRVRQQTDARTDGRTVPAGSVAKDIRTPSGNNQSDTGISSNERMRESVSSKTDNAFAHGSSGTSRSDRYAETNVSISSQPLVGSQRRSEISKEANAVSQRQTNEGFEEISRSQTAKEDTAVSVEKQEKINIFRRITNFFNPSGHRNQHQAKSSETSGSSAATEVSSKRNQTSFSTVSEDPTPKAIKQFKNIQSTIQTANPTNNSLSGIQNSGLSEMMTDLENENISSAFIPAARHISSIFSQSLASTPAILQWLNYVDNPLSGNNNFSRGLRAWATMLVTIRMKQFGMEASSPQNPQHKKLHDLQEKARVDDSEQWPQNFLKHLTEHIDKMHQNQMQRNDPLWTNYVPLPTPPQNVKENCMSFSRKKSEGKKDSLELSFYFEIKNLGPVGIKVNYAKPDISVKATAETYEGYSKVRETMHFLEDRFKQLNLNCHDFNCTKGTVSHPNPAEENSKTVSMENSGDGLNLRI